MNRTLVGAAAAAILLPAGIVAVMLAAPASADEPPGPPPPPPSAPVADAVASPEMLAAMQRDLGLTATGARERIAKDNAAGRTGRALRKKLGPKFGGAWLTADAKSLVVAVTDSDMAAEVTAAGATPKLVDLSAAKLDAVKATLDKTDAEVPASVPGWYVDPKTNTVVVQARGNTDAAEAFIKASGVDDDAVRVVKTTEQPTMFNDVRGGDIFWSDGASCSVGFSVIGGFVSAGHCGDAGNTTTDGDGVEQGTFKRSSFPGNDFSFVSVNSKFTPQPWVNDGDKGNVIVAGATVAAVGAAVCRSGATTGWRCGVITGTEQTITYTDDLTKKQYVVSGLTRTTACAGHGDSGGSVLAGQQAQGVLSGGSGDCSTNGITYFQPLAEIMSTYNLTLVTSENSPRPTTPPASSKCAGFSISATGSLTEGNAVYVPDKSYYYSSTGGTHSACLDGPSGTDFDLALEKWNSVTLKWDQVATIDSDAADKTLAYVGTVGWYTWRVTASKGSGSFTLGYNHP